MDKFRFTRFTKIYPSRKRAIEKLDETSRYYAEMVAIMYKNGSSFDILLALYRSETKGDYSISYDSASEIQSTGKIYTATREEGETFKDVMKKYDGMEKDILLIDNSSFIFHNGHWNPMISLDTEDSSSVSLEVTEEGTLKAEVKIIDCGYL